MKYFIHLNNCKWYYIFNLCIHIFIAVYRNKIDFHKFILYPGFLMHSFIPGFYFFHGRIFGIFYVDKISSANRNSFISTFLISLISFSYLIAWLKLLPRCLIRVLKVQIIFFFLVLGRKHSFFHH